MKTNHRSVTRIVSVLLLLVFLLAGCANVKQEQKNPTLNTEFSSQNDAAARPTQTTPKKRVALTFDDGPHNVYTKSIVDELSKYGAHATFFVVGSEKDGVDEVYRRIVNEGHTIGMHSYSNQYSLIYSSKDAFESERTY